jgi:hypothetical protein
MTAGAGVYSRHQPEASGIGKSGGGAYDRDDPIPQRLVQRLFRTFGGRGWEDSK